LASVKASGGQRARRHLLDALRCSRRGTALAIASLVTRLSRGDEPRERDMEQNRMKIAYVITQRKDRNFWNRVGVAFVNNDGSINVKLEAVPVSGEIQIRDYQPKDELASTATRSHSRDLVEEEPYAELA
jgi:hypothetical protein